jgi:predicted alpha/beta superfamily hydrolase
MSNLNRRTQLLFLLLVCLVVLKLSPPLLQAAVNQNSRQLPHSLTGDIRVHKSFHSQFLPTDRDVIVYLPPNYDQDATHRYPVLYLQDGENVFDIATCFWPGFERHFDERAEMLIGQQEIEPLIIVGIYSTKLERINEYTPTKSRDINRGGEADLYGRMLVEEIKPFIDGQYRTLPGRANTGLGGSSLGGLVSLYIGFRYPQVFGKLAITSPAAYWDDEMIVRYVKSLPQRNQSKLFLSVGSGEPQLFVGPTRDLHEALVAKGWKQGKNFFYSEPPVTEHRSGAWTQGVDMLLEFLFPPKASERAR